MYELHRSVNYIEDDGRGEREFDAHERVGSELMNERVVLLKLDQEFHEYGNPDCQKKHCVSDQRTGEREYRRSHSVENRVQKSPYRKRHEESKKDSRREQNSFKKSL